MKRKLNVETFELNLHDENELKLKPHRDNSIQRIFVVEKQRKRIRICIE